MEPTGTIGKAYSFQEVIEKAKKKHEEQVNYVKETGLCCVCKTEKVVKDDLRCTTCIAKMGVILRELRGKPGFFEGKL
jgi:hypothetical protein